MKQVTINLYKFDELSDDVKQMAISNATNKLRREFNNTFIKDDLHDIFKNAIQACGFVDVSITNQSIEDKLSFRGKYVGGGDYDALLKSGLEVWESRLEYLSNAIDTKLPDDIPFIELYFSIDADDNNEIIIPHEYNHWLLRLDNICWQFRSAYNKMSCDAYCSMAKKDVQMRYIEMNDFDYLEDGRLF